MFKKENLVDKGGTKPHAHLLPTMALLVFGMIALMGVASANYSFDGSSLEYATSGCVNGDVWVSAGDHAGLPSSAQSYTPQIYVTNYTTLPSFESVKWAHYYVGVWGGTAARRGYANTSLTCNGNEIFSNSAHIYSGTTEENIKGVGSGTWVVDYDVTTELNNTSLSGQTLTASIATTNEDGYTFDGRVYDGTLVIVYDNGSSSVVAYQINDGLSNFNNQSQINTNYTVFENVSYNSTEAEITIHQIAGDKNQWDFVYFNPPDEENSPYRFTPLNWVIGADTTYTNWELGNQDVANNSSSINPTTGTYFDIDTWTASNNSTPLNSLIKESADNTIVFKRGWDSNGNGVIDAGYYTSNKEGESYVSPVFAIIKLTNAIRIYDFSEDHSGIAGENVKGYYGSVSGLPGNATWPETAMNSYNAISLDDSNYYNITATEGNSAASRFEFNISEDKNKVIKLIPTWIGREYNDDEDADQGAKLYIWNYGSNSYELLDNDLASTEITLTKEITNDISNYISDSGKVTILVIQNDVTVGANNSKNDVNYVKLEVSDP